jgi:hypothetical protein
MRVRARGTGLAAHAPTMMRAWLAVAATMMAGCRTMPFDEVAAPAPPVDAGVAAIAPVDLARFAPVDLARFAPVDLARRPHDLAPVADLAHDPAPVADLAVDAACPPADVPSRQTVTFRVHNRSTGNRYVVTNGLFCDPFAIEPKLPNGPQAPLPLNLGFQCPCECAPPSAPYASEYHLLPAGELMDIPYQFSWDARALALCVAPYDCAAHGWPGGPVVSEMVGALQPVEASLPYHVQIGVEGVLPPGCETDTLGQVSCPPPQFSGTTPSSPQAICPAGSLPGADFVLPPVGDLTVDVEVY